VPRLSVLIKGEFNRLNKYNLFAANFVVLLVWVVVAWFMEGEILRAFLPVVFLMDSVMMTVLLVGATLFYEKKEHTINSIMISPVTEEEYLLAKVIVNVLNSLITVVFISIVVYLIKGVTYNYLYLVPAVVVVTAVHSLIGIRFSYSAKDFTSLLVNFFIYVMVFLMPSIFAAFGLINKSIARFLIVLPPEVSSILVGTGFGDVELWKVIFGYGYLIALGAALYRFSVKPAFSEYVMKETGV
jgi:fluoroquinolone transport system permease protein